MTDIVPPVVDERWAVARRPPVVFADVRWYADGRSGRDGWAAGHLPGAVFVDLDTDLSSPPTDAGGRHPLPSPSAFADRLGRLGIGDDDTVVAYDDAGGSIAARLVWMLRVIGQPAALLDGGIAGWPGPLETAFDEPAARAARTRRVVPWPEDRFVDRDAVREGLGGATLIDARAAARFDGSAPASLDKTPGHIPGARSAPWAGNLDETHRFLPPDALRARFAAIGVDDAATAVASCGSGVTACHDLLALEHAGLGVGRLFTGSWSAWTADPTLPVELGDGTA